MVTERDYLWVTDLGNPRPRRREGRNSDAGLHHWEVAGGKNPVW